MKQFKKIMVLENDSKEVPSYFSRILNEFIEGDQGISQIDYWFDFNMSFHWDMEGSFKRMADASKDTLFVCMPSFVGYCNSFDSYINLFLMLRERGISINIAIYYPDNFLMYLLKYVTNRMSCNTAKLQNRLRMLREILEYHNVSEIDGDTCSQSPIRYDDLMAHYFETASSVGCTRCRVKATGEIHDVYSVFYGSSTEDIEIVLRIESNPNNRFKFNDIEKL